MVDVGQKNAPRSANNPPAYTPVADGAVLVGPVMAIPRLLREHGVEPDDLLTDLGLTPEYFGNPENTISFQTLGKLLGRCRKRTGCDHFGLLVGQQAGMSTIGPLGFLMQSAPDVGSALASLARQQVHDRGGVIDLQRDGQYVSLDYRIARSNVEHAEQILDAAIAIGFNILRGLCGSDWKPKEVRLARRKPADVEPYRQFFRITPWFDAERSGLTFPAALLERPLPSADAFLHMMMANRVGELVISAHEDVVHTVERVLRQSTGALDYTAEAVAKRLGIQQRTLNRRLEANGTTFRALRDQVRFEVSCQLLENTSMRAGEVASALGYADAAAFTRAFKRWAGATPSQWRHTKHRT